MAHKVSLEIPSTRTVLHKDIRFEVSGTTGRLGTLLVSKGNIEWLPSPKSVKKHRLSWKQFAAVMVTKGKPARASKKTKKS
jgi:hypothetical protein